jgi:hypothetical protein
MTDEGFVLSGKYIIERVSVDAAVKVGGREIRHYSFKLTPLLLGHERIGGMRGEGVSSDIINMPEWEFERYSAKKNTDYFAGRVIALKFKPAVINRSGCGMHKVEAVTKEENYSPKVNLGEPITIVRLVPNCDVIHMARSSYANTHFNITMLAQQSLFAQLKQFLDSQPKRYADGFEKREVNFELTDLLVS